MPNNRALKPEHEKAMQRLQSFLSECAPSREGERGVVSHSSFVQGSIGMYPCNVPARLIPSACDWRWNQAKGKKETSLSEQTSTVVLTKLIPRRRCPYPSLTKVPRYKLWHFEVKPGCGEPYTVLWCEKGTVPAPPTQRVPPALALPFNPQLEKAHLRYICN